MYVKLFASILDSSIWSENYPTRLVWITMLAMADAEGTVKASPSGIARRAAVTRKEADAAIKVLMSPDKDRPDQEHDGRRLDVVDGGWLVLNYEKYREIRTQQQFRDAIRQKRHRERSRTSRDTSRDNRDPSQHAEAYAEAEAEKEKTSAPRRGVETWLTPYVNTWQAAYGGDPACGKLAKYLKPLHDADADLCAKRWKTYVASTEGKFASPARFAETYGMWDGSRIPVSAGEARDAFAKAGLNPMRLPPDGFSSREALESAIALGKAAVGLHAKGLVR